MVAMEASGTGTGGRVKRWAQKRTVQVAVWVAASALVGAAVHLGMQRYHMESAERQLVSMCEERARMLQDQFAVSVNHVHALAILVSTFHFHKQPSAIDQATFAEYTAMTAFERPLLSGVAYAQRVVHAERQTFENQQGWVIKTMKGEPSPEQDEYAPVIFSQETISYIEALDMMSGEEDRENILRARATGKAVLTSPFRLLQSNHLGVVLTFPVYHSSLPATATVEERVEAVVGYLGGAFDVESLVETLLKQLAGDPEIVVNVYDITNASMALIMYGPQHVTSYMPISHISMLDFGDPFRRHQMECRYSQKPPIPWSAIYTPTGVFVIAMLIGYIIFTAYNRYVTVVEDCRKMEELKVKAEAADIAKSQFLATVSHEIRTPMNGVLGMLDMLLDTDLKSTQTEYVQTAQVCGKALIALINEVLDRAKIEAGKLEMEAVPFDLRSILDDVISLFSTKSDVELAVFVSDEVPDILMGDPRRFRQIITNLVGNSVKFTERGHIFIQVHLVNCTTSTMNMKSDIASKEESEQGKSSGSSFDTLSGFKVADGRNSWESVKHLLSGVASLSDNEDNVVLIVSVEDTGIGIPLHAQDRVFTPFMQADSSTSRNYGGTGIGLSISKCLVELMRGQITFVSKPDIGSTFTFTAVLKRCGNIVPDIKIISEPLPTCFRGKKAVVLDKKPVRGAVTRYHLQRLGITVEVLNSSNMALSSLSGKNGYSRPSQLWKEADMIFIENDFWKSGEEAILTRRFLDWQQSGQLISIPKIVLLVNLESDKALASRFVDLLLMKPLRASTVAACLLRVLGIDRQQERKFLNELASLSGMLSGKKILVVDDNKVNLKVAERALNKYGASVECAESGKDALMLLQIPHKFDACFMDVQMPEMDGFEATKRIRLMESQINEQTKSNWHVPILAMTADVIQATYEECMKCGMDGYVSKPFEEKQLFQAVAKCFFSENM